LILHNHSQSLRIIKAEITPGTHPQRVSKHTSKKEPQPLSITANGGKNIDNKTRSKLIGL